MTGKVCVVTGANAGLGFETAKALAEMGATVVMVCRSESKGRRAQQEIIESTDNQEVHLFLADLAIQQAIRTVSTAILSSFDKVDVLVNNAAAILSNFSRTVDGIETQFAVNHLGGFLLTHGLFPGFRRAEAARIINVSSGNHFRGSIHFDDIHLEHDYQVLKAYNQSKLANVLFTYELDRRLTQQGISGITVNAVDPGTNNTDIGVKATNWFHALAWKIRRLVSVPASVGARTQIHLAASETVAGISGKYWYKSRPVPSAQQSNDTIIAERLWELSKRYCQVTHFFAPS